MSGSPGWGIDRRRFVAVAAAALAAWRPARAAPKANARVGYLELVKASDGERLHREFVEAMQDLGYVRGRNLEVVRRSGDSRVERLRPLAIELGAAKVDVVLCATTEAAKSVKQAAPTIPGVFVMAGDPVFEGLVATIARPGGRLTGVLTRAEDLTPKRLQILKDAFPRLRTVAVVGTNVSMARADVAGAASRLGLSALTFPIYNVNDIRDAAAAILRSPADAVLCVEDADDVAGLTAFSRHVMGTRRPAMFTSDVFVQDEGWGLMAYGPSLRDRYRRAATLVARVLEGAKPADLPVEMPTRYELVVNLRAAQDYGITLPADFVLRADRVIR